MTPADVLLRLRGYEGRLLVQIDQSTALAALDATDACLPIAKARWSLARMLREYQLFKHTEIFDPAILHGDKDQAAVARRMRAECIAAGEHFTAYVARWSRRDVAAAWPEYRAATREMIDGMRRHIAREQREAAALLAGRSWTRKPASLDAPATVASDRSTSSPGRSRPAARADSRGR